jgi:membrane-bound lytic murein transglycosylase B
MPLLVAAGLFATSPVVVGSDYLARADVRAFIDSMHQEHGVERALLERVLGNARHTPAAVRLIGPRLRPRARTPGIARNS